MNVLSDKDIIEILDHYKIPINAIKQKDRIDSLNHGYYIINLQSSKDGNGTHWTALYFEPEKSLYFDAFGFPPPEEVEQLLNEYEYNKHDIQNINSSSCGFYCIAFIKFMHGKKDKEKAFDTFINMFKKNTFQNENILNSLL